jgi:NAD(P)-dependent dehydrogenase (short-subunit alcohol dehydrogenase family)
MTDHNTPPPSSKVWFISGCTTGLGLALARRVLAHGGRVVATGRDIARRSTGLEAHGERVLLQDLDVTQPAQIQDAVAAALRRFGVIDVLVNNAGYGYQSTVEEGEDAAIRDQFEVNCFGLFALTRAVLPGMRARGSGHIISVTSVAGFVGFAGSGYYAATKHAVEGWSDALAAEVGPLGIRVTCVAPGPFRTDWAGRSLQQTISRIDAYAQTAAKRMQAVRDRSGKQAGDPDRAAEAVIAIVEHPNPPRHLLLGKIAIDSVSTRLARTQADIAQWQELTQGADFPE